MNRETETDKKRVVTTRIDDFIETNILYWEMEKIFRYVKKRCKMYNHELISIQRCF